MAPATGSEGRFELQEPVLRLHYVVMNLLASKQGAATALVRTAEEARKAGQLMHSMAAIHELHTMLQLLHDADGYCSWP